MVLKLVVGLLPLCVRPPGEGERDMCVLGGGGGPQISTSRNIASLGWTEILKCDQPTLCLTPHPLPHPLPRSHAYVK